MTPVDVEEIDHAGVGKQFTDPEALIKLKTAIESFIKHHSDANNVVITDLSANFFEDFNGEANPVFQRATVFIGAPVNRRCPKTVE